MAKDYVMALTHFMNSSNKVVVLIVISNKRLVLFSHGFLTCLNKTSVAFLLFVYFYKIKKVLKVAVLACFFAKI